jgi:predicted transposase YbfD/YdcC
MLSTPLSSKRLNAVVRHHWEVENRLHWRLDIVMNEDHDRTRPGHGPQNLAVLRHMALNTVQQEPSKDSPRGKLQRAAWNNAYLTKVLALL